MTHDFGYPCCHLPAEYEATIADLKRQLAESQAQLQAANTGLSKCHAEIHGLHVELQAAEARAEAAEVRPSNWDEEYLVTIADYERELREAEARLETAVKALEAPAPIEAEGEGTANG